MICPYHEKDCIHYDDEQCGITNESEECPVEIEAAHIIENYPGY
jgi:hypothetical protein